jgi:hypothetical protein
MAHTPGPWRAELGDVPYAEFENEAWIVDCDAHSVCTLDGPADCNMANAHLIAAAPDLLAACEIALEASEHEHVRKALRAAIARATQTPEAK